MIKKEIIFIPVNISILTISDSRSIESDKSGQILIDRIKNFGHKIKDRKIVKDEIKEIVNVLENWVKDDQIDVIITTGGTGLTGRDVTP